MELEKFENFFKKNGKFFGKNVLAVGAFLKFAPLGIFICPIGAGRGAPFPQPKNPCFSTICEIRKIRIVDRSVDSNAY